MRYIKALVLTGLVGMAASLYTPSAKAAGVYVGIGLPVPVVAPQVVVGSPWVPAYYHPYYRGPGYRGPAFWGYGHAGYGYSHPWHGDHGGWGYHRR